jgi:hypothetical protein
MNYYPIEATRYKLELKSRRDIISQRHPPSYRNDYGATGKAAKEWKQAKILGKESSVSAWEATPDKEKEPVSERVCLCPSKTRRKK